MNWPVSARPVVRVAALFALNAERFSYCYNAPTHALHLHEYAGTFRLKGRDHSLVPGTLTFSPAGLDTSYDLPRQGVHWCIHFEPAAPNAEGPFLTMRIARPLGAALGEAVHRFAHVSRLHAAAQRSKQDAPLLAAAASVALQELLVWTGLLDHVGSSSPSRDDAIEHLFEHIDRNLAAPLRAADLAEQAGLSQNYLARIFRRRTGQSLPRYVLTRRIAAARLLLTTTNLPVKQVALRVGFPDAQHFNKQFRASCGTSPTAYRRESGEPS